jgi:hypothetical protein
MQTTLWSVGVGLSLLLGNGGKSPAGYLAPPAAKHGKTSRPRARPYAPREGDLIFFDEHSWVWNALFFLAGTGPPVHMGIVVKKPGGQLAVLEAGPDDTVWVRLLDLKSRLRQFHRDYGGTITIRRCKVKLNRQKSAALTRFARAQNGKRYAVFRLLLQATPFRARGLLAPLLARTYLDRDSWICSELAVAAGTVAGLFNPKVVPANATYPLDLVDNRTYNLRPVWHDPAEWKSASEG